MKTQCGEVDPDSKHRDPARLQGNCCPPGGPFDWRNEVRRETATLGPAHYRCFAISNRDNKLGETYREQKYNYVRSVPINTNIPCIKTVA